MTDIGLNVELVKELLDSDEFLASVELLLAVLPVKLLDELLPKLIPSVIAEVEFNMNDVVFSVLILFSGVASDKLFAVFVLLNSFRELGVLVFISSKFKVVVSLFATLAVDIPSLILLVSVYVVSEIGEFTTSFSELGRLDPLFNKFERVEAIKSLFVGVVRDIFSLVVVASPVASLLVYVRFNVVVLSSTILAVILIFLVELVMVVLLIFRLGVNISFPAEVVSFVDISPSFTGLAEVEDSIPLGIKLEVELSKFWNGILKTKN